jgi:hypothetical protein
MFLILNKDAVNEFKQTKNSASINIMNHSFDVTFASCITILSQE